MASALEEEWSSFLDRYNPVEVNARRPKSLKNELQKLIPMIPDVTRTSPRDMDSFKLYLRDVIFSQTEIWKEVPWTVSQFGSDSSVISMMLNIMDYLSLPCHTNEEYLIELVKSKSEIAELREEVRQLRAENLKLSKQVTRQQLPKSSNTEIMNTLRRLSGRNQSSSKTKENESKSRQFLRSISKLNIKAVNPRFEDNVRKVHVCVSDGDNFDDPCPCAERVMKKISCLVETELMCAICWNVISKPILLQCGHIFCDKCLNNWKEVKPDCPYCRSKIQCDVRIPSFLMEMLKLELSNNTKRSRLVKPSEPTKNSLPSTLKDSDTRTRQRLLYVIPSTEENPRN